MYEIGATLYGSGDRGLGVNRAAQRQQWRNRFSWKAANDRAPLRAPGVQKVERGAVEESAGKLTSGGVQLHIKELVLRGVSRMDGRKIADAFQRELRRRIAAEGIPNGWCGRKGFDDAETTPIRLVSRTNARWMGERLARAICNLRTKETR
jgi:hypothetical protein